MLYEVITRRKRHPASLLDPGASRVGMAPSAVITSYSIHYTKLYEATGQKCSLWTAINALIAASNSPLGEKMTIELQLFTHFINEHRSTMLSGKDLGTKVKKMVDEIDYWSYLVQEYQKNEKAARYKFLNIDSLINSMTTWEKNPDNFKKSLFDYLNRITLISRDDQEDEEDKGKVNLMTIHASKGRITSYNVCYTKLLRGTPSGWRSGLAPGHSCPAPGPSRCRQSACLHRR